ncbi:MAG: hypothetical protein SGPRY_005463, partial [Prymnesium sp.]
LGSVEGCLAATGICLRIPSARHGRRREQTRKPTVVRLKKPDQLRSVCKMFDPRKRGQHAGTRVSASLSESYGTSTFFSEDGFYQEACELGSYLSGQARWFGGKL